MARIVFFITFLGLFLIGLSQNHAFATSSPYNVKGVEVDILDESAVKARNRAFIEAQRKAFEILSTRYYAEGELKVLKIPNDDTLSGFIQDFKITSEQVSSKRYKGVFDFRFKAAAVNQHFGRGPINFTGEAAPEIKKILLIPYYHEEKKPVIFNKTQNPFWGSLLEETAAFRNVILPEGTIQDLTDIGNRNSGYLSPTTIRRLKARYEVGYIAIATASVSLSDQTQINVDIQDASSGKLIPITNFNAESNTIAKQTLSAVADIAQPKNATSIVSDVAGNLVVSETEGNTDQTEVLQSEINPDYFRPNYQRGKMPLSAREQMIQRAQQRNDNQMANGKDKRDAAIPVQQSTGISEEAEAEANQGEVNVHVFFNSMSEWVSLQKEMSQFQGIRGIRIVTLKTNQGDVVIEYSDWNKLLASLKANGFILNPQSADSYILKRLSDAF